MESTLRNDKRKSLLIVDDEADIAEILSLTFEKSFRVEAFTDPQKALDSVMPGKYDMALIDYLMPEIDGFTLYEKMKSIDPSLRICVMTAYEIFRSTKHHERFVALRPRLDATSIIRKPFTTSEITDKVSEILSAQVKVKNRWHLAPIAS